MKLILRRNWDEIVIKSRSYYDCHMLWLIIGRNKFFSILAIAILLSVIWLMYFEFYLIFVIGFHDITHTHTRGTISSHEILPHGLKLDLSFEITFLLLLFSLSLFLRSIALISLEICLHLLNIYNISLLSQASGCSNFIFLISLLNYFSFHFYYYWLRSTRA